MTNTLKISAAALVATFAMGGLAQAEGITIDLTGKDAKTIHNEIVKAAIVVCRDSAGDSIAISTEQDCVVDTIAKAQAEVRRAVSTNVARADLSAARSGER